MEKYFLLNRVNFGGEGYIDVYEIAKYSENIYDYPKLECGGPVQIIKFDTEKENVEILKTFIFTDSEMTQKLRKANPINAKNIYAGYYFSMKLRMDTEPGLTFLDFNEYSASCDKLNSKQKLNADKNLLNLSYFDSYFYNLNNLDGIKKFITENFGQSEPTGSQPGNGE